MRFLLKYPAQYLTQMALYRELVRKIYPGYKIRCLLLWVNGPEFTEIPDEKIESALQAIKEI